MGQVTDEPKRKRIALFFDGPNHSASVRKSGVDIPFRVLIELFKDAFDIHSARYYTGISDLPEHEGVKVMAQALPSYGYTVITKKVKTFPNGKIKANLDVEIAIDMVEISKEVDVIVLFSGDGDFCYPVRLAQANGVEVNVISCSEFISSDLIRECSSYTDLGWFAKNWLGA